MTRDMESIAISKKLHYSSHSTFDSAHQLIVDLN